MIPGIWCCGYAGVGWGRWRIQGLLSMLLLFGGSPNSLGLPEGRTVTCVVCPVGLLAAQYPVPSRIPPPPSQLLQETVYSAFLHSSHSPWTASGSCYSSPGKPLPP